MNKLQEYIKAKDLKERAFERALVLSPHLPGQKPLVVIGPTSKGNIFIKYRDKEIGNTETPDDLRELGNAITIFLKDVVGEP